MTANQNYTFFQFGIAKYTPFSSYEEEVKTIVKEDGKNIEKIIKRKVYIPALVDGVTKSGIRIQLSLFDSEKDRYFQTTDFFKVLAEKHGSKKQEIKKDESDEDDE